MRRTTTSALLGLFIATAPALAQPAGTAPGNSPGDAPSVRRHAPATGCGFLGIYPNDIGSRTARKLGLSDRRGAVVAGVVEQTGASRAGIRQNDVITGFNGEAISGESQLRRLIMSQAPGAWVRIDLRRDGQTVTINAEITSRAKYFGGSDCPPAPTQPPSEQRQQIEELRRDAVKDLDLSMLELPELDEELQTAEQELDVARRELRMSIEDVRMQREMLHGYEGNTGLGLQKLSPQLAEYFRSGTSGALVNDVAEDSPADHAGIAAGDVIVAVNGSAITGPMDAVRAIVDDHDGSVEAKLVRDGRAITVTIDTRASGSDATAPMPPAAPELGSRRGDDGFRLVGGVRQPD